MILFLDTSGFEQLHFALLQPETGLIIREKKQRIAHPETEKALTYLQEFLSAAGVKPAQFKITLSKIIIVSGPGSFTGIRAGFAHALAFALALNIPVYHIRKESLPKNLNALLRKPFASRLKILQPGFNPDYGRKPNITVSRKS